MTSGAAEHAYVRGWHAAALAGARRSPDEVVPLLMDLLGPTSVADIGCGPGTWLAAFREQGVYDLLGVEGQWLDRLLLQIPAEQFLEHDLEDPLPVARRFDLVLSLEVAEHLPERKAPQLVDTLTRLAPVVAFSAAVPYQGGTRHINEQWPGYWAALFEARGYVPVDCLRPRLWLNEKVAWYYRQNLLLFVEEQALARVPRLARAREAHGDALPLVHPERYLQLVRFSPVRLRETAVRKLRTRLPRAAELARRVRAMGHRTSSGPRRWR